MSFTSCCSAAWQGIFYLLKICVVQLGGSFSFFPFHDPKITQRQTAGAPGKSQFFLLSYLSQQEVKWPLVVAGEYLVYALIQVDHL